MSYRECINKGLEHGSSQMLREACDNIARVITMTEHWIRCSDYGENCEDDAALIERLTIAKRLIEQELPRQDGG